MKQQREQILNFLIVVAALIIVTTLMTGCTSIMGNTGIAGKYVCVEKLCNSYIELNGDGTYHESNVWGHMGAINGKYIVKGNNVQLQWTSLASNHWIDLTISNDELIYNDEPVGVFHYKKVQ